MDRQEARQLVSAALVPVNRAQEALVIAGDVLDWRPGETDKIREKLEAARLALLQAVEVVEKLIAKGGQA